MIDNSELENITLGGIQKILNIDTIFKYVDYDTAIDSILKDNSLKFSNPKSFNDPFDCNEDLLQFKVDKADIDKYTALRTRQDRRKIQREFESSNPHVKVLRQYKKDIRICCFSELYDEVLMWSHYADKHNGVCIGFNFPMINKPHFNLYPVTYIPEIVPIQGTATAMRVLYYWLTTKSIRWDYEKEIRAISHKIDEFYYFDKSSVKRIYFGCKNNDSTIKDFKKKLWKYKYKSEIELYKMEIDKKTFLLKPIKI